MFRRRRYEPPPRPPASNPVPLRVALAGMDADPAGDTPSAVCTDGAAVAVARLLGWDRTEPGPSGGSSTMTVTEG